MRTSIAALMELINTLYDEESGLSAAALGQILPSLSLLLGPFAPYLAEELWEQLGRKGPVFREPWPVYDEALTQEDAAVIAAPADDVVRQAQMWLRGGGQLMLFAHTRRGAAAPLDLAAVCVDEKDILGSYSSDFTLQEGLDGDFVSRV